MLASVVSKGNQPMPFTLHERHGALLPNLGEARMGPVSVMAFPVAGSTAGRSCHCGCVQKTVIFVLDTWDGLKVILPVAWAVSSVGLW